MNNILNITNGDSAVNIMKEASIEGKFLPWRDVLHVGAVPSGLSFEELSIVRTKYIVSQGWGNKKDVSSSFNERLEIMNNIESYDKVILWFEHDLYDQLQLLEILNWFATHAYSGELSIICTDNYLGKCSAEEISALIEYKKLVSEEELTLAKKAWEAFSSETPQEWANLLTVDTSSLPFLESTVWRFLKEYPSCKNALSKIEQDILEIVDAGEHRTGRIFGEQQKREEAIFLADTVFVDIINGLMNENAPLLKSNSGKNILLPFSPEQEVSLTNEGKEVMFGKKQWLAKNSFDKWLGGVHLTKENYWCWDGKKLCK